MKRSEGTRSHLLLVARHMFALKGLSGTSIRDIARSAKLNSSLISYYFGGKEGLYRACVEEIAERCLKMAKDTLEPVVSKSQLRRNLSEFLSALFEIFLNDRETGLILIREYDRQHSPARDIFKRSLQQILKGLEATLQEAQDKGYICAEKDTATLASLLFGCVTSQMRMEHLRPKKKSLHDARHKRRVIAHIVDLFVIPDHNEKSIKGE